VFHFLSFFLFICLFLSLSVSLSLSPSVSLSLSPSVSLSVSLSASVYVSKSISNYLYVSFIDDRSISSCLRLVGRIPLLCAKAALSSSSISAAAPPSAAALEVRGKLLLRRGFSHESSERPHAAMLDLRAAALIFANPSASGTLRSDESIIALAIAKSSIIVHFQHQCRVKNWRCVYCVIGHLQKPCVITYVSAPIC
jgi:hypothetical protein